MEGSENHASTIDESAARVARASSSLNDDFHRQGRTLRQSQVDRTIERRHLTPDEGVRLQRELRERGIIVLPSAATNPAAAPKIELSRVARRARDDEATAISRLLADPRCQMFLTEEEEVELGRAIHLGREMEASIFDGPTAPSSESLAVVSRGKKARERMTVSNIRLVAQHAYGYSRVSGLPPEDLLQDGLIGLLRAVEGFDHTAGFRFSTYATWWIRQSITRAIDDTGPLIRVPVHCAEEIRKLRRVQRRLERRSEGSPAKLTDLADELNWEPARIRFLQEVGGLRPVSFDQGVFEEEDQSQWEALPDLAPGPEELAEESDAQRHIREAFRHLPKRTAQVLRLRFGLDGNPPMTLEEIGQVYNLTRERIRQVEAKALKRLGCRHLDFPNLHDLLDRTDLIQESMEEE
jgi:RNA polymerase primary sigma factor